MELTELLPPAFFSEKRRGRLLARIYFSTAVTWVDTPCVEWLGAHARGYSYVVYQGQTHLMHRLVYRWLHGIDDDELTLDHRCRNRGCIRPDHLELVTRGENVLRGVGITAENARKTHCPQGHEYDYAKGGRRMCRTCRAEARRAYRQRIRDAGLPVK